MRDITLTSEELIRLRVMDTFQRARREGKVNVRSFCRLFGMGKSTFYKWKKRYKQYNLYTIKSQSRKPKTTHSIAWNLVVELCTWKRENPAKSHYYLYQCWIKEGRTPPCSPKTIYNWWKKRGLIQKKYKRLRRRTKLFNHATIPGELIQIDTKYLLGRRRFQYTSIDVVSKWRYVRAYTKLNQEATIDFLKRLMEKAREKGISIQRIQTDNGLEFQSEVRAYLCSLSILHQHTWIHTPDQNGVVERSHRTMESTIYITRSASH